MSDEDGKLLTNDERAQMLRDIVRIALTLGSAAENTRDAARQTEKFPPSPAERLWLLDSLRPELTQAIYQISQTPSVTNVTEARRIAPPERARRVRPQAVLDAVQRGHAGRFLEETAPTASHDTPENRAVKAFLTHLEREAVTLAAEAEQSEKQDMATAGRALHAAFRRLRRAPILESVADETDAWRKPPTHFFCAAPGYRQIADAIKRWRDGWEFDGDWHLPARETWRLYEMWTLLRVIEALRALEYLPETDAVIRKNALLWRLATGAESKISMRGPGGDAVAVFYNRPYSAPAKSLSHTMLPDIVLETPSGVTYVLDAKFKAYETTGTERSDIAQMHAYRDAIVGETGVRVVTRAWCLYAGQTNAVNRALISYGPPARSLVGALCMRPGDAGGLQNLVDLLRAWLKP